MTEGDFTKYPFPGLGSGKKFREDAPMYGVLLPAGFGMQITSKDYDDIRRWFDKTVENHPDEPVILWRLDHGAEYAEVIDRHPPKKEAA